jgi:WD40 repeat protein
MGVVYRARQTSLNRVVALKMILAGAHAGPDDVARFRAEAEAAARLQHPNIVQIHEVGEHRGLPYFSLEFCAGGSLAARLDGTPLSARDAAALVTVLARAVQAAHDAGVVHRDLKPANVLLAADGTPKITDFGLAKRLDGPGGQTRTGAVLGTPSYMAPEQAGGKTREIGPAADVYALGAILYELLTGRPPFRAETSLDTVLQVLADEPVPPGRLVPKLPRDVETICLKCLQKEPARRYPSAAALADDLQAYLDGRPIAARPVGRVERGWRWCRRNPALAGSGVVVALVLVVGSIISTAFGIRANRNAEQARRAQQTAEEAQAEEGRQRAAAEELARANQRQLIDLLVSNGNRLLRADDPGAALPWFAEAARRDPDDPTHAGRLNGALAQLPRPVYLWRHAQVVRDVAVSPDGRRAVTGCEDGTARIWDLDTGAAVGPPLRIDGAVVSVAFSPDGKRVATAGGVYALRGEVRLWDAATGAAVGEPLALPGTGFFVGFSADGNRLVTSELTLQGNLLRGDVKNIQLTYRALEAATGKFLGRVPIDFPANLKADALTVLGEHRVHAGTGRLLRLEGKQGQVLDVATGRPVGEPLVHERPLWFGRLSPDGGRALTVDVGGHGQVRDLATGKTRDLTVSYGWEPLDAAFNDRGEVALAFYDGAVQRYRLADGRPVPGSLHKVGPEGWMPRFDADGVLLSGLDPGGAARVWEADSGQPVSPVLRHGSTLSRCAFAAGGRRLLVAAHDGSVRVWDLALASADQPRTGGGAVAGARVEFDPAGRCLVVGAGRLSRFDPATATGEALVAPPADSSARTTLLSPDGSRLLVGTDRGEARLLDAATLQEVLPPLKHDRRCVFDAAFGPGGRTVVTLEADSDGRMARAFADARLWDLAAGKPLLDKPLTLGSFLEPGVITCLAFSPDGRRFALGGGRGTLAGICPEVQLYDGATGKLVGQPLPGSPGLVPALLAFRPDGRRLAVVSIATVTHNSCDLVLWDVEAGKPALPPLPLTGAPHDCAFDPVGERLAVASGTAVRVFDAAGRLVRLLPHPGDVNAVRYQRQGRVLLSVSERAAGHEVYLWDAATGEALRPPLKHRARVESAALSPDGRFLVTAGERQLHVWDLAADPARGAERERLARLLSCQEIDGTMAVPVPLDRLAADWEQLRRTTPDLLTPTADQLVRWHDRQGSRLIGAEAWAAAARQYEVLASRQPEQSWWGYVAGNCCLAAGDRDGLRRQAADLLRHQRDTTDPYAISRTVKSCLIVPDTLPDPAPAFRLAERLETARPADPVYPWLAVSRAIALYRAGRPGEAAAWIGKARIRTRPPYCGVLADLFLSMIRHQQGRAEEARKLLDAAGRTLETLEREPAGEEWINRIHCREVLREAKRVVLAP